MQSPFGEAKPREAIIASRVGKTEEEILKEEVKKEKLHVRRAWAGLGWAELGNGGGWVLGPVCLVWPGTWTKGRRL